MEFKRRMTFEEMEKHMLANTGKISNRVSVGKYARENGFKVYKPMIGRKIYFFYVNEFYPLALRRK